MALRHESAHRRGCGFGTGAYRGGHAGTATAPAGVHFTSGPSETFASRDEALAAGHAWRNAQQLP
ncbi:hypothetical protein CJO94_19315 (plasmid) [Ralstonia solanacearum]|nr:hypothetical protein CJO94_19315 [Ralstonia solanacearum]